MQYLQFLVGLKEDTVLKLENTRPLLVLRNPICWYICKFTQMMGQLIVWICSGKKKEKEEK